MNKKSVSFRFFLIVVLIALIFPQGVLAEDDPPGSGSEIPAEGASPFQEELQALIDERAAAGLPVPASVEYEYEVTEPVQTPMLRSFSVEPEQEQGVVVTAKTTIQYDNPQQAGYEAWPSLDVGGTGEEGNFGDLYYQKIQETFPDYWETYEFGQEPREYTHIETYEITYSKINSLSLGTQAPNLTTGQILMGFTYTANIDYWHEYSAGACIDIDYWWLPVKYHECFNIYEFGAGLLVDAALGLRLPAEVTLSGLDQMVLGKIYGDPKHPDDLDKLSAVLTPLDWDAVDYENVGVAAEDGNEFVMRLEYKAGVKGVLLDTIQLCPLPSPLVCYLEDDIDKSDSFTTPFGQGSYFPIDPLDIDLKEWGLSDFIKTGADSNNNDNGEGGNGGDNASDEDKLEDNVLDKLLSVAVGISLQPQIGSSRITANWQAMPDSDCIGNGEVEFSAPGELVIVGPITACNKSSKDDAKIRLSDFRYWFNEFSIALGLYLKINMFEEEFLKIPIPITTIDLGKLANNPSIVYLGKHQQCQTTKDILFACGPAGPDNVIDLSIPVIDLLPPTSTISLDGTTGNNGWYRSEVEVTLSALDNFPGCTDPVTDIQYSLDGNLWNEYTDHFTIGTEGLNTIYYRAMDTAGNIEATKSELIKVDKTPPLLSATRIPPPNGYGWNNTDVTVHFTASDAVSGLDLVPVDPTFTQEGSGQSVTAIATDLAGNSITLTVSDINIDKTDPTLVVTGPQAGNYANTTTITTAWIASDALSGIASETGSLDGVTVHNGQSINLLLVSAGPHNFVAEAVDKADNAEQVSIPIFVTTDIDGLIAAKEYMCDLGWINKLGVCNSLDAKLRAAKYAIERGKDATAINQIEAFINELSAQNGKAVEKRAYDVLRADALYIIEQQQ